VYPPGPQHCARGIEPASVELAGLQHATVFSPNTAIERGRVQVCSVTRVLQHCARGIEPASGGSGTTACYVLCPSTARGVTHVECAPASVGVYMCVSPQSAALCARD